MIHDIKGFIVNWWKKSNGSVRPSSRIGFTPAELRVLTKICFGEPVHQIAKKPKIAPDAVSTRIHRMFKKLRIHAKAKLISKTLLDLVKKRCQEEL